MVTTIKPDTIVTTIMGQPVTYSQTAQGAGYMFNPVTNQFEITPKPVNSFLKNIKTLAETAGSVISTIRSVKNDRVQNVLPSQNAVQPYIITLPDRDIAQAQPYGVIYKTNDSLPIAQQTPSSQWFKNIAIFGLVLFGLIMILKK